MSREWIGSILESGGFKNNKGMICRRCQSVSIIIIHNPLMPIFLRFIRLQEMREDWFTRRWDMRSLVWCCFQ
jgi:hypothetical protein